MVALLKSDELSINKEKGWYFLVFNGITLTKFRIEKNYYHVISKKYNNKDLDFLTNMRTEEKFQNMGYGRYLLTEIMKERKFFLTSYKEAEGFYRKCGLKEVHVSNFRYTIFENL